MENKLTQAERLAKIETILEINEREIRINGDKADKVLQTLLDKIDMLDAKLEARFAQVEEHATRDSQELQALKNKGAGVLAAIGVVFTLTATLFADAFSSIKHAIFG